jgi:hypothetical protein
MNATIHGDYDHIIKELIPDIFPAAVHPVSFPLLGLLARAKTRVCERSLFL